MIHVSVQLLYNNKMSAFFPNKFSLLTYHDLMELRFTQIMCTRCDISVSTAVIALGRDWGICNIWSDVLLISAGQKIPGVYARPVTRAQKLENLQLCMSFMGNRNIDLQGIYVGGKCVVHVFFNFLIPWSVIPCMMTSQGSSWHSVEN